ncbi:ABC transporter substrate-binding protein [Pseudonocardia acaciae]|uniref:ABC transporter substrate-binding protein n=1 Tax=Pseudonocardia acaciae TaxID=551276 RepID=UPI00048F2B64|nr:extracellular solute-binding protein [Pseudonocardia acaciae]
MSGSAPLSRRRWLKTVGLAGGVALTSACGAVAPPSRSAPSAGANGKLKVTLFAFLGGDLATVPKEFAKEYEAAHRGVQVEIYEQSNTIGYAKMLAQKKVAPDQPLVNLGFFNAQTTAKGIGDRMWSRLDYAGMSNAPDIDAQFRRDDQFGIGIGIGADQFGLVYNHEKLPTAPTSWADLWNPAYRGKVCLFQDPWYAVFVAAMLNGGSIENMEPGWQLWQRSAEQIRLMVISNPQYLNVLASGTAPLTAYFAGTGQQWIDSGAPLSYVVPREGAISQPVYLQAVAGSTDNQLEVAHDMINQLISPKWSARWASASIETPANTKTPLPHKLARLPAFAPATRERFIKVDYAAVGRNSTAWRQRWDRDVSSRI